MWGICLSTNSVISYIEFKTLSINFYFHKWQWVFSQVCVCICVCTYVHMCVRFFTLKIGPGKEHQELVTPQMLSTQKSRGHLWFLCLLTFTPICQLILALLPPACISDSSTSLYFHCFNINLHYPLLYWCYRHPCPLRSNPCNAFSM